MSTELEFKMPKKEKQILSSNQLYVSLRERFPKQEYAVFSEVRRCTGFSKQVRSADAIAMSLWPSRGLFLHGFEFKCYRSDFVKELQDPSKAEAICQFCDFWWLVVGDKDIVKLGELPKNWGLLVPNGTSLKVVVDAPKLVPQPMDRDFLASLFRNAQESLIPKEVIDETMERRIDERVNSKTFSLERTNKDLLSKVEELGKRIQTFEEKSGVRIDNWNHEKIGEAVRFVMNWNKDGELKEHKRTVQGILSQVKNMQYHLEQNLKAIELLRPEKSNKPQPI